MDVSLNVAVQLARNEIKNTISKIESTYKLPSYIVDGILSESVAEIRSREQAEISSDIMQMYMKADVHEKGRRSRRWRMQEQN